MAIFQYISYFKDIIITLLEFPFLKIYLLKF